MRNRAPVLSLSPAQKKLLESCGPCHNCNAGNGHLAVMTDMERPSVYVIECARCEYMGPWAGSIEGAIRAWLNSKA